MNNPPQDKASSEQPLDVGALLRQKRMNRGQSLEAVHQQTRIPKKFLEALEANKTDAFPAGVYLRGFMKGYCDYLEVDFDPLWNRLSPAKPVPEPEADRSQAAPPPVSTPASRPSAPPRGESGGAPTSRPKPIMIPVTEYTLVPIAFFAALILATLAIWLLRESSPPPSPHHRPPAAHSPAATPPPIAPLAPPTAPSLQLTALQDTWIRLKVDGTLRFEGRVPSGNTQDWRAQRSFSLRVSDPAALRVLFDEKEVEIKGLPKDADGFAALTR